MAKLWQNSVDRFCAQYFQVQDLLQFPDGDILKLEDVQEYLHERLFSDDVVYQPHVKYRISTLKRITSLIESSIDDWDQYVSCRAHSFVWSPSCEPREAISDFYLRRNRRPFPMI